MCAVNNSIKIFNTEDGQIENDLLNPESVTQCWAINEDEKVISLWSDSVIRIFYTFEDDISEQVASEFKGHKLSVTAGCSSPDEMKLVTSSKDMTTILWDMNTSKKMRSLTIDHNQATDMVWSSNHNNVFYQASEDLKLRIFDSRDPINVTLATIIDDTVATSMDIDDTGNCLITGHRGSNNNDSNVKFWDLRKMSKQAEPVFTFTHNQAIVSARFYYMPQRANQTRFIASASCDETLRLTDVNWNPEFANNEISCSAVDTDESYTSMWPLRSRQNAPRIGVKTDRYIIAGTEKPQIILYIVDDLTLEISEYKSTSPTAVIMD